MMIKTKVPTMRHVSRTHIDWLFDKINLKSTFRIKYVDIQNQFEDILTEGSFSQDEWNHLLRLFNIMSFSMYSCIHFSDFLSDDQIRKQSDMSKRGQTKTDSPMTEARSCFVARVPSEEISSRSLNPLVNPGDTNKRKKVEIAAANRMREDQLQTHK